MSAENITPPEPSYVMRLDDREISVFQETGSFPEKPSRLAPCVEHLGRGNGDELVNEFWLTDARLPGASGEQEVRYHLRCEGMRRFSSRCALRLVQTDAEGTVLGTTSLHGDTA